MIRRVLFVTLGILAVLLILLLTMGRGMMDGFGGMGGMMCPI